MAPHGTPDAHIVIYRGDCAEDCSGCVAVVADGQTYSSGTVVFSAGPNITISTVGQTIFIEGAAAGTGAGISAIVGSNATYSTGTVIFTGAGDITVASTTGQKFIISGSQSAFQLSNSNGLTWGTNGSTVTGSYSQSTHSHAAQTAYVFSNSNDVTFGTNGSTVTASFSQSTHSHGTNGPAALVASDATYTSGTVVFTGSGAATVKSAPGQQVVIDVSESTHAHSSVVFSNSNNVTFGLNAGTLTATASFAAGNAVGAISASDTEYSSGTVEFIGSNAITVKTGAPQQVVIDMTQSTHSHSTSPSAIVASDATYTSGTVVFTGSNLITVATSGTGTQQTVIVSGHNHGGIAASNTTFTSGTVVFSGSGITVNTSGTGTQQTIGFSASTHSHAADSFLAVAGSNTTFTSGTVIFTGSNITVSTAGAGANQTVGISGPQAARIYDLELLIRPWGAVARSTYSTNATIFVQPFIAIGSIDGQSIRWRMSYDTAGAGTANISWAAAYYTQANTSAISLVSSTSWFSSWNATDSANYGAGERFLTASLSWPLSAGQYVFIGSTKTSGSGAIHALMAQVGVGSALGLMGTATAVTNVMAYPFLGTYSSIDATFPAQIANSEVRVSASQPILAIWGS